MFYGSRLALVDQATEIKTVTTKGRLRKIVSRTAKGRLRKISRTAKGRLRKSGSSNITELKTLARWRLRKISQSNKVTARL